MPPAAAQEIREANARYHDLAADRYDGKWGISYTSRGQEQVVGKLRKALGREPRGFARGLEIGAGTGYFSLNLLRAGVLREAVATDISPGMLAVLSRSARRLGLEVETACCEADSLPFEDGSFDLVYGHAVLHHLPDLAGAFREFRRVLAPGGTLAFCGEPSRNGDRLAALPKRAALAVAPLWRTLMRAGPHPGGAGEPTEQDHLERVVDVHAFSPADLSRHARRAGLADVRVRGEELAANVFGWVNRSLEATAAPDEIPWAWRQYAYRGYLAMQTLDRVLLEQRLPAGLFYNLLLSARRPS